VALVVNLDCLTKMKMTGKMAVVRILRGTISGIYGNLPDISRRILTRAEKSGVKFSSQLIELNKLLFFSYTSSTCRKFHENGL
jgi:hypothetical protein